MLYGEFNFCTISLKSLLFDLKLGNEDNDDDNGGGGGVCVWRKRGAGSHSKQNNKNNRITTYNR